jgi:chemotaxis regulatin CheY-phosphate phosphatase CheZ
MTGATAVASKTVNPDLKQLHEQLVAVVAELDKAVGRATTASEVTALLDEISEVTARVTNVGRQLFTQQTDRITAGAQKVTDLHGETLEAIRKLESVNKVLKSVTSFLATVDKVVDLAKHVF